MSALLAPVLSLAALWIAAPSSPVAPAAAARLGPPLLCHPFPIGEAESLPWGEGAFSPAEGLSPARAAVLALEMLAEPDDLRVDAFDLVVRMETVRRGAIATAWRHANGPGTPAARWLEALRGEVARRELFLAVEREPGVAEVRAARGRARLQLAYALEAFDQLGSIEADRGRIRELLDGALADLPEEPGARLVAALIDFSHGDQRGWREHLGRALELAAGDARMEDAISASMGPCVGASDTAGLVAVLARD